MRACLVRGRFTPIVDEPSITVISSWVGGVTDDGATVKMRSTDAAAVHLRVSVHADLSGYSTIMGTEGNDDVWTCVITGLDPSTDYYYGFAGSAVTGAFRTFPAAGAQASFSVAAGSCMGLNGGYAGSTADTSNPPTFDRMRDRDPLLFIHMGDLHYRNLSSNSVANFRTAYKDVLANAKFGDFVRNVPTAYVYDDHDFGPNDSDGTSATKPAAQSVYREYVPSWDLPEGNSIYQTIVVGRVRFILLDVRSERSPNGNTDNGSKTRIGAAQKTWFKALLLAATEPVIVVDVHSWIGQTTGFVDGWGSFATERTELFDFFVAHSLMSRLLLIGGDLHELMWDDGTHTNFATGAATNGPPYAGFAPLDAEYNDFSATAGSKFQTRNQQYGTLAFDDQGTQIVVTVKGWAVNGGSESQVFTHDVTYSG